MEKEYLVLEKRMIQGADFDPETSKKFSTYSAVMDRYASYKEGIESASVLAEMVAEETDADLASEAQKELEHEVVPRIKTAVAELNKRLLPEVSHSDKPALLELRPGVGGSEAAIFAKDLLNMYTNFANHKRWACEMLGEGILSINAPGSYNILRHESGVHRVQRIPATETKGRVHTLTAAVVVLPKISDGTEASLKSDERLFAPGEVRIDTMRAGGKGGQHVNTTDSAVRLVHIPTGIIVQQQDERLQPQNKAKAFAILRARLAALEREKEIAAQKKLRTDQVTTTDRSDKIRTYNYPQNRVTDHRCGLSVHDVAGTMGGERLEEIIERVEEAEFEERLAALVAEEKKQ